MQLYYRGITVAQDLPRKDGKYDTMIRTRFGLAKYTAQSISKLLGLYNTSFTRYLTKISLDKRKKSAGFQCVIQLSYMAVNAWESPLGCREN